MVQIFLHFISSGRKTVFIYKQDSHVDFGISIWHLRSLSFGVQMPRSTRRTAAAAAIRDEEDEEGK